MHCKSIFSDLYADKVGHDNNDSYESDNDWKDKAKPEEDVNLVSNMNIDEDKLEDIKTWVKKINYSSMTT